MKKKVKKVKSINWPGMNNGTFNAQVFINSIENYPPAKKKK